ncbi:hypothetical protein Tco_1122458 [Tanacetum coccineum]|uniref:Uncharacterized protein n=1 Tax=Tanacetum coccineum TaxID=301880 RepID=A0ABQ5J374_9ASTR
MPTVTRFMVFQECFEALIVCIGNSDAINDLTILNNSSLLDNLLEDIALVAPFLINGVQYEKDTVSTPAGPDPDIGGSSFSQDTRSTGPPSTW